MKFVTQTRTVFITEFPNKAMIANFLERINQQYLKSITLYIKHFYLSLVIRLILDHF